MKNPYPNEKFSNAFSSMATSPSSIQQRVADAYLYNLIHVKPDEVPEEIRAKFIELKEKLTRIEPEGDEGRVISTTYQMSIDEAVSIANNIVDMAYTVMCDYYDI